MLSRFTVGDTFQYTEAIPGYPASAGWVLKFRLLLRDAVGTAIALTCTASGDDHLASVAAATTAGWVPGTYTWSSWVERDAEKHSVGQGQIVLAPDPRTATGAMDARSQAAVALANVRAVLAGVATANVLRYEIAGRSLQRHSIPDLIALETKLVQDVKRETNAAEVAAGRPSRRVIFGRVARA